MRINAKSVSFPAFFRPSRFAERGGFLPEFEESSRRLVHRRDVVGTPDEDEPDPPLRQRCGNRGEPVGEKPGEGTQGDHEFEPARSGPFRDPLYDDVGLDQS